MGIIAINNILPKLPSAPKITETTDTTDFSHISNDDFINAVFGDNGKNRPVVVSFGGNPSKVQAGAWTGKAHEKGALLPADANNYISCASYHSLNGQYRRTKAQFEKYHWLLCDDVGSKVQLERMELTPSWIIETSESNFQYGYILAEPLNDAVIANQLIDGVIAAGLCDKGASGAASRIGRLPFAINGKTNFQCKLTHWQPELKYSIQDLVDGLEIELKEKGTRPKKTAHAHQDVDVDTVHIERLTDNPVIDALKAQGLYKLMLGAGKHDITCPNLAEHTDRADSGAAYFEPSESYSLGGFKCLHGHCTDFKISYLLKSLGIGKKAAKHLPTIRVIAGEINQIVDRIEIELSTTGRHYQRGSTISIIVTDPKTSGITVQTLSVPALTRAVSTLAIWERFDKRSESWFTIDPPERHIKILSDAQNYEHLPFLKGIARQPFIRADGSLVNVAGYDTKTHMFGEFNPYDYNIPKTPTRADAEKALDKLKSLLSEFDFKSEHDRSAALAGILTATIRAILKAAPMIHVDAHSIGSGKSYLCQIIALFATPSSSTPHTFPSDDEEMKKLLFAEFMTAPAVISFDNLEGDLKPYPSLMTALTEEYVNGRILGQSKTQEAATNALFLSSGNNVQPVRDATRRVITITLDPQCETPATRVFENNPVNAVAKNRSEYISAALTIIRAWIVSGRPITPVKPLNSYGEWSELCRQPLIWLGLEDPAQCVFDTMAHDPDREFLGAFLVLWFERYGTHSTSVKNLMGDLAYSPDLNEMVEDVAKERDGTISRRKLGWWLKKHSGRVVDGLRLVADARVSSNAAKWQIEKI